MLFRQILQFWKLHLVALWLDMLKKFFLTLFLTICHGVLCEDYFQQATQRGLDYGKVILSRHFQSLICCKSIAVSLICVSSSFAWRWIPLLNWFYKYKWTHIEDKLEYFHIFTSHSFFFLLVRQIGIPFLESELQKINIPTISGSTKTPLSDFTYELSR